MRPSTLNPGDIVLGDNRRMTFVRRDRRLGFCLFQCDDYRGMNGPEDRGITEATDQYVTRHFARGTNAAARAAIGTTEPTPSAPVAAPLSKAGTNPQP